MKNIFSIIALAFVLATNCSAQNHSKWLDYGEEKNVFKLELASLITNTVSFQYERALETNSSITVTMGITPKGKIPFAAQLENSFAQANSLYISKYAITAGYRHYFSGEVFHGFYFSPFLKVAGNSMSIAYTFKDENDLKTIPLSGNLIGITAGILLGAQYSLGNRFNIDLEIIGPHFGFSTGELIGPMPLNANEITSLQKDIASLDLPLVKTKSTITNNGASINLSGPWMGVRSNIGIGYKFK